ncbi:unnamed protein product, partial [Timema podura]|nr:unnamed protein product [Timema podura]
MKGLSYDALIFVDLVHHADAPSPSLDPEAVHLGAHAQIPGADVMMMWTVNLAVQPRASVYSLDLMKLSVTVKGKLVLK